MCNNQQNNKYIKIIINIWKLLQIKNAIKIKIYKPYRVKRSTAVELSGSLVMVVKPGSKARFQSQNDNGYEANLTSGGEYSIRWVW